MLGSKHESFRRTLRFRIALNQLPQQRCCEGAVYERNTRATPVREKARAMHGVWCAKGIRTAQRRARCWQMPCVRRVFSAELEAKLLEREYSANPLRGRD